MATTKYIVNNLSGQTITNEPILRPYKVYTALLTQTGLNNPPIPTVLENTLGGVIVWTYGGLGYYIGTLTGAFAQAKTFLIIQKNGTLASNAISRTDNYISWGDINTIYIQTTDQTDGVNDVLNYTSVEIRIYN